MPRAVVCHKLGPHDDLVLEEVPKLSPGKGEAVVQVISAGLCFPDVLVVMGKHVFKMQPPFTPCNEFCGAVTAVGEDCDMKVGDVVFGRSATTQGTLRDEILVQSAGQVYPAPEGVCPHVLAGLETNYGTTYHALKDIAKLQPGERLCVLGASGATGISAIELGKAMGATVVACASSSSKLEACRQAGADVLIDYSQPGFKEKLKKDAGGPLDVVYDPVGGEYSEVALRALGFGGRFLVIGFAAGGTNPNSAIPKVPLNLALLNERQILGVLWGSWKYNYPAANRQNMLELISMIREGRLKPRPPEVFPLEGFKDAMSLMMGRQAVGKICLNPSGTNPSKL
eukprot:TRINITY_DN107284_c0_g1_i1.p1 TRINITY_DN107284_c0_g1~~TRINITY_DN107284_c0_g1_i1.p1  ORF type:complete len:341 (+),score=67.83 TRINITY_DN107284_c0_g1_i1:128-1150(+)